MSRPPRLRFRTPSHAIMVWAIFGIMGLLGVAMVWQPDSTPYDPGGAIMGGALIALGLFAMGRSFIEGIEIQGDRVIVRKALRTLRFAMADISRFSVGHGGVALPIWRTLTMELKDGKRLHVGEIRSLSTAAQRSRVDFIVEALNGLLSRQGGG